MRKMYQSEWQCIRFSDFATPSSVNIAGSEFYQAFYREFFKRYRGWDQLSPGWRKDKELCAQKILERAEGKSRILAVGCGLGYVEHYIRERAPQYDLFLHEVAPLAWSWIGSEFAEDRKILGSIPACLPDGIIFELAYLSAVDYALDDDSLVDLLSSLRLSLNGGRCLLFSASFEETPVTLKQRARVVMKWSKDQVTSLLARLGLCRVQLWGWSRTQEEYRVIMKRAGYRDILDGFLDLEGLSHYWIEGSR